MYLFLELVENWGEVLLLGFKTNNKRIKKKIILVFSWSVEKTQYVYTFTLHMLSVFQYFTSKVAVNNFMPINVVNRTHLPRVKQTLHAFSFSGWKSLFPWSSSSECPDDAGPKNGSWSSADLAVTAALPVIVNQAFACLISLFTASLQSHVIVQTRRFYIPCNKIIITKEY